MDEAVRLAHLDSIERDGYTIVPDAIDPEHVARLLQRVRELERETLPEVEEGSPVDGSSQLRTGGLLSLDPVFWDVPIHQEILPIVEGVLGLGCLLTTFSAIDVMPGENRQPLHPDDALIPLKRPHQPIVCTCMWAITDFTEANAATRLLPGSHRLDGPPEYEAVRGELIPAEMKAGSVLVFDGSLWHQAADNVTEDEWRLGLQVSYCAGWIRPFTNHFLSIHRETAAKFPERLVELVGYSTFNGAIGTIGTPGTHRYANSAFRPPASALGR
ncbi:phytanoyl-CoA dioxygenase family protein [Myxococcota bacterium]|nr:phytanoyl-CoA dioxygenase family protein [Myxococcota bacterium]